jgi:hypothetical protein
MHFFLKRKSSRKHIDQPKFAQILLLLVSFSEIKFRRTKATLLIMGGYAVDFKSPKQSKDRKYRRGVLPGVTFSSGNAALN